MEILYLFTNDTLTNRAVIERIDNHTLWMFQSFKSLKACRFLRKKTELLCPCRLHGRSRKL